MLVTVLAQALAGWLLTDLLSGVFHWWEDRVARVDLPIVGRSVIAPNRLHHQRPLAFTEGSLWRRNGGTWVMALLIAGAWLAIAGASVTLGTALLGGLVVNEIHFCAHRPLGRGAALRLLWKTGLVQSPRHHAGHHAALRDRRYCALTDWLNPWLDDLRVWSGLEAMLDAIGLTPNRGAR